LTDEKTEVIYVTPSVEQIEAVARAICSRLEPLNPAFGRGEVVYGLAEFIFVMARIGADRLNRRRAIASLDKESQTE